MPARNRANIVCTDCHARKVKCDLQSSLDGICTNCRRSNQLCLRRDGLRRRRAKTKLHEIPPNRNRPRTALDTEPVAQPASVLQPTGIIPEANDAAVTLQGNSFVSHCSTRLYAEVADETGINETLPFTSSTPRDIISKAFQNDPPPRPTILRAWIDAYTTNAFHHCPVVEQEDLKSLDTDSLLQKSISLIGNSVRHDSTGPKISQELYEKVKVLLCINREHDPVQMLKAICLVSLWGARPSNPINIDGPWHWTGVAARLAMQMGLHRESTYQNRANSSCLRRIFWFLHNSDCLQAAFWGRPSLLRSNDFDVRQPTLADFETPNAQSRVFIESTKLCMIYSKISDLHAQRRSNRLEETNAIDALLCEWVSQLPEELRLYDGDGTRKAYYRPASEILIQYFVAIIVNEFLKCRDGEKPWKVIIPSLVAASCAVTLYDEIDCRDEAVLLPSTTGFFCLAVALPLIHFAPEAASKEIARKRGLRVLRSILQKMIDRYGDSQIAVKMINSLDEKTRQSIIRQSCRQEPLQGPHLFSRQLFPFPESLGDNMELLKLGILPDEQVEVDSIVSVQNWPGENSIFDSGLMDLFFMDIDRIDDNIRDDIGEWNLSDQDFL